MFFCPLPNNLGTEARVSLEYEFWTFPWDSHIWVETEIKNEGQELPDVKASEPEVYLDGVPLNTKLTEWATFRTRIDSIKSGKHNLTVIANNDLVELVKTHGLDLFFQVNGSINGPWFFYWRNVDVYPTRVNIVYDDEICTGCGRIILKDNTTRVREPPPFLWIFKGKQGEDIGVTAR